MHLLSMGVKLVRRAKDVYLLSIRNLGSKGKRALVAQGAFEACYSIYTSPVATASFNSFIAYHTTDSLTNSYPMRAVCAKDIKT